MAMKRSKKKAKHVEKDAKRLVKALEDLIIKKKNIDSDIKQENENFKKTKAENEHASSEKLIRINHKHEKKVDYLEGKRNKYIEEIQGLIKSVSSSEVLDKAIARIYGKHHPHLRENIRAEQEKSIEDLLVEYRKQMEEKEKLQSYQGKPGQQNEDALRESISKFVKNAEYPQDKKVEDKEEAKEKRKKVRFKEERKVREYKKDEPADKYVSEKEEKEEKNRTPKPKGG